MDVDDQAMVTREQLTKPRLPEDTISIDGLGTFRVRGLSRFEVLVSKQREERLGMVAMERMMLAAGLLDPSMSEDEVTAWQKASPAGEIEPVVNKIAELSGMLEDAGKAAYKSDGDGPVA
jgi:alanine racemase